MSSSIPLIRAKNLAITSKKKKIKLSSILMKEYFQRFFRRNFPIVTKKQFTWNRVKVLEDRNCWIENTSNDSIRADWFLIYPVE